MARGYSPLRRWLRRERAREWEQTRRFDMTLADLKSQLRWAFNEAPGLRALADLFGVVPMMVTFGPGGTIDVEMDSTYRTAAIAIADPERPWTGFAWGPPGFVRDPRFPEDA